MDLSNIAQIGSIAVITYLIAQAVKCTKLDSKWIPIINGVIGAILGLVAYYTGILDPNTTNILDAIATGIMSGFASTGVHQIYKQLTASHGNEEDSEDIENE